MRCPLSDPQILPPLRDVALRPEQDTSLRGQLVRLMTHVDTDVKDCAAELLFVLCKENGTLHIYSAKRSETFGFRNLQHSEVVNSGLKSVGRCKRCD